MSRGAQAIEQPGGGEYEGTGADRQQARTTGVGPAQCIEQHRGRWLAAVAPAWHDNGPGGLEQFHAAISQYLEAAHGAHRAVIDRDDPMRVPGEIEFRSLQSEDLDGDTEFESTQAVVGEDRDQTRVRLHLAENSHRVSCAPL
ncbi:hypothetical protein D3C84_782040 [compost metagenome]